MDEPETGRLTYGSYLRVPQLTNLQRPLADPSVHGEMFFVIGQQVQELWFKQILFELREIIRLASEGSINEAARLLDRVNRIVGVLCQETELLQTLPPVEFKSFRPMLSTASGFESEQFRELEWASGLRDAHVERLVSLFPHGADLKSRWPVSLREVMCGSLSRLELETVTAIEALYDGSARDPSLFAWVESLSEYELRIVEWRFHHLKVVERVIGTRSPGTGGSSGGGYLSRTLDYRFFPELWEARNRLSARAGDATSSHP